MRIRTKASGLLALIAMFALGAAVPSQADDHRKDDRARFEIRIPFEFMVGNLVMPAGLYRVEQLLGSSADFDIVSVRCLESRAYHAVTAAVVTTPDPQVASRLVFHRYGNRAFLAGLWIRGKRVGLQLHASETESQVAQAKVAPEEVSLTLNGEGTLASAQAVAGH